MLVFITILREYNILKHWPILIQFDKIRDVVGKLDINHTGFWIGFSEKKEKNFLCKAQYLKVLKFHVPTLKHLDV